MESGSKRISEPVRYMEKLDDFLFIEILRRLPRAKFTIRCKLVCRHWNSVISYTHPKKHFAIITSLQSPTRQTYTLLSNDSKFQDFDYNFALSIFKSTPPDHKPLDLEILATYNELLLCLHRYRWEAHWSAYEIMKFYIYSPVTKHHVALPPSPLRPHNSVRVVVGFLCRGVSSFRVVHIFRPKQGGDSFTMHIFSSEENEWTEHRSGADGSKIINDRHVVALAWNGLLCWKSDKDNRLVLCNPYSPDDNEHFHFIATPRERHGLGVFQETLRLCDLRQGVFSVWDLKDYSTGEWSLKYQFRIDGYNNRSYIPRVIFDPNCEDVVYFVCNKRLFTLNMKSGGDSSVVNGCHLSLKASINIGRSCSRDGSIDVRENFLMLVMSGLPTPINTFPQNAIATDTIAMPFDRVTRSRAQSLQKAKES